MCKRTKTAQANIRARLNAKYTREAISERLGVNSANISNLLDKNRMSSTLDSAMVAIGWLDPKPTRVRLAIDCDEATRRRFREAAARHGMTGEEYLLALMEEDRKS